jgi:hypothetical protein
MSQLQSKKSHRVDENPGDEPVARKKSHEEPKTSKKRLTDIDLNALVDGDELARHQRKKSKLHQRALSGVTPEAEDSSDSDDSSYSKQDDHSGNSSASSSSSSSSSSENDEESDIAKPQQEDDSSDSNVTEDSDDEETSDITDFDVVKARYELLYNKEHGGLGDETRGIYERQVHNSVWGPLTKSSFELAGDDRRQVFTDYSAALLSEVLPFPASKKSLARMTKILTF